MNLLYVVHRIPFPPNKGDKIRSFRWLQHLAISHQVYLVSLYDDPNDRAYIEDLQAYCADLRVFPINKTLAKVKALASLPFGQPLSLPYFASREAMTACREILSTVDIDLVFCFSAPMAEYVRKIAQCPVVMDMVDVDSAKFKAYSELGKGLQARLYGIEAKRLSLYEQVIADELDLTLLCTEPEAKLLRERCQDARIEFIHNGVIPPPKTELAPNLASPNIIFIGAMDYQANVDAVVWAAHEIMPLVIAALPEARFQIIGRDPSPEVLALDGKNGVEVLGAQEDLSVHLRDARMSLIPLRIAQGIQNKALEAMSWALPVVTAHKIASSMEAKPEQHLLVAESAKEYAEQVIRVFNDAQAAQEMGQAARDFVIAHFTWEASYSRLDEVFCSLVKNASATCP